MEMEEAQGGNDAAGPRRRVAFQGEPGAYSEEAAFRLLGAGVEAVACPTFESLFASVGEGRAECALAPVENSLAGDVARVYDLLGAGALFIVAEVVQRISHNLVGCPGATLEGVRVVESHPVALAQCERFFAERPHVRPAPADDTAASVRRVVERGDPSRAALASARAAQIYGGRILAERLEDDPQNFTRFVLLAAPEETSPPVRAKAETSASLPMTTAADKLSLVLTLPERPDALWRALAPFARRGFALLRVASRPVKGRPWRYRFFLDFKTSGAEEELTRALSELRECAEEVRVLGRYAAAAAPLSEKS